MLKRKNFKCCIAIALVVALLVTVFAPVCSAEEAIPTMPDLSGYSFITIDEIEPETTVDDIIEATVFSANEEVDIYDSQGYLLSDSDYVGNGATIIISENSTIVEVYKIRLYVTRTGSQKVLTCPMELISSIKQRVGTAESVCPTSR